MDNITKGDPIKADWANALTNAINAATHGKTSMRGGGGQNVSIAPYQRGSRPLAFDLVEITDDAEASLSGKVSGGLLFHSYKEEQGDSGNPEEKKILLKTEKIAIEELAGSFKAGEKVWVKVSYDSETWKAESGALESGSEVPAPEDGTAYFVVGEFEEHDKSIIYKHYGVSCIKWDALKWEFKEYKLKTDPLCALELKEAEEENELTLNIEASSEEENVDADSNLKVWLVQKKGKGEGGAEEGPVRLGVRIKDERSFQKIQPGDGLEWKTEKDADGDDIQTEILQVKIDSTVNSSTGEEGKIPVDLSVSNEGLKGEVDLKIDSTEHDLGGGGKINLSKTTDGALSLEVTPGSVGENLGFMTPLRKNGSHVLLDYDRNWSEPANGVTAHFVIVGGALSVELHADTTSDGADGLISDSWTVLACDSDHALRLKRNDNEKIYIQQGEWNKSSNQYEPIN